MSSARDTQKDCQVCETVRGMTGRPLCRWCLRSWRRAFGRRYPRADEVRLMRWAAQVAVYGRAPRRKSWGSNP